ncbi:MAG: very short patch repair endonuclease [Tepidisphaerales bacterium]
MMDRLTSEHRSWNMSRIRNRNTRPEMVVRSALHRLGHRFRLATGNSLPGRPDVVLPSLRLVVFVHGCFWHRHDKCKFAYTPKSRVEFWQKKFEQNRARDQRAASALRRLGWRVLVVWECQCEDREQLMSFLKKTIGHRIVI